MKFLYALLVFVPLTGVAHGLHWDPTLQFVASLLAIVPLAKLMGSATEEVALRTGPGIGGLLNATFGNATELIIALFALNAGLYKIVQASITGSIIGNILFVLGLAIFAGGLRYPSLHFNRTVAGLNTSLLMLAVVGLLVPAAYEWHMKHLGVAAGPKVWQFSALVAVVLILVYVANLVFALRTHADLYAGGEGQHDEHETPTWSMPLAVGVLLGSTVLVALMSEVLVGSIEHVTKSWGLPELFIGVILVPIVGNAAEHMTAVTVAMKNKMDLSLGIAIGSTTQIALLIAPVLVLAGWAMGKPLTLSFDVFEVVSVMMAVAVVNFIVLDGESNWLEGLMLLATYGILAVAFLLH
ncbi:MAG: calcium/proton exchanger [Candidatus Sericytochromatia bacterium]|nr:calcium/proton exchanger [Candidatus Sericytochromatia bacterium]